MIMHVMLPITASQRLVYLLIGFLCFLFLGVALFLQHVGWNGVLYPPCPLCILQRIGFLGVGFFCIIGSIVTPLKKVSYGLASLFTVGGLSAAIRQLWVIAYPKASKLSNNYLSFFKPMVFVVRFYRQYLGYPSQFGLFLDLFHLDCYSSFFFLRACARIRLKKYFLIIHRLFR